VRFTSDGAVANFGYEMAENFMKNYEVASHFIHEN